MGVRILPLIRGNFEGKKGPALLENKNDEWNSRALCAYFNLGLGTINPIFNSTAETVAYNGKKPDAFCE